MSNPKQPETTIRSVHEGPPVHAPEWAARQGSAIATQHYGETVDAETWQRRAALGALIAEALYATATPAFGGTFPPCETCNGMGVKYGR